MNLNFIRLKCSRSLFLDENWQHTKHVGSESRARPACPLTGRASLSGGHRMVGVVPAVTSTLLLLPYFSDVKPCGVGEQARPAEMALC